MNASSTVLTAFLRAVYLALITGALTGLGAYQQTNDGKASVIAGLIAGLTVLAGRGLGEGAYDATRQTNGDIKPGDVQPIGDGKAV